MRKILHITPHLGGGVGTVLLKWFLSDSVNENTVITLDYANDNATKICRDNNINLLSEPNTETILNEISKSDITVIHFWNHPLLYDFIIRNKIPNSRIAIWSHISGVKPPQVLNQKLLDVCDKFVFTTPVSKLFFKKSDKTSCILSTAGAERFQDIKTEKHDGYNVGYIGTIDYAKMHPDYIKTLSSTSADKIFITGTGNDAHFFEKLRDKRFVLTGWTDDAADILKKLDVFAYMLSPNHYGTGEQVLQEAMSAGVVPVVMNNPCEESLVKNCETGLVAKSAEEYIKYIDMLKDNTELRKRLSKNAKKYAAENFKLSVLVNSWNKLFNELEKIPKTEKLWKKTKESLSSYDIFLESLGEYSDLFRQKDEKEIFDIMSKPEWTSQRKGSPRQYYDFLKGEELKNLCIIGYKSLFANL